VTNRRESTPADNVIPGELASRLLARASELDALRSDDLAIVDLRAAAAEAGISGPAFDAALSELRRSGRVRASEEAPHRRTVLRWGSALIAGAALIAGGIFAAIGPHASHPQAEAHPQQPHQQTVLGPTQAVIRSADGASPVTMAVGRDGDLFASIGVALGPDGRRVGRIEMAGSVGSATTPTALKVGSGAGEVMFRAPEDGQELEISVPGTAQRARGHAVRVVRDRAGGPLRAEVVTP